MNFRIFAAVLFLLSTFSFATESEVASLYEFPLAVNFEGRVRPLESFEALLAEKVCEKEKCAGIPSEDLLLKILLGDADSLPIFRVNRATAVDILHLPADRRDFRRSDFEPSRSLLHQYAEREDDRPLTLEFVRLDAALTLYDTLQNGYLSKIAVPWNSLSEREQFRVQAESVYLKTNPIFFAWILACVTMLFAVLSKWKKTAFYADIGLHFFLSKSIFMVLLSRGIIEGRVPLTSLLEMVLLLILGVSLATEIGAFKTKTPNVLLGGSALVLLLFLLLRSALLHGDTFAPVSMLLNSSFWLSLHVFTIAAGFCVLILASVLAHIALWERFRKQEPAENLTRFLYGSLGVGFGLSALGTLLGGFWADVAWGRFWGWDPKENAALLVLLWTLLVLHLKAVKLVRRVTLEAMTAFLAVVIAFCLFGVNQLGVGLHSYGYSPRVLTAFVAFAGLDSFGIAITVYFAAKRERVLLNSEKTERS